MGLPSRGGKRTVSALNETKNHRLLEEAILIGAITQYAVALAFTPLPLAGATFM